jgi:rare lipoprotein A
MARMLLAKSRSGRFHNAALLTLAASAVCLSTGCLHRHRPPPPVSRRPPAPTVPPTKPTPAPPSAPIVQGEVGIASWYGHPYHGRRTASGEIYNMYGMTAAHRTLPFGTQVRVHNLENGRDVAVRINDRGPFVEGRIIDLSFASAQAMGMPSTALVRLELLGLGSSGAIGAAPGVFAVQVGAFRDRRNAELLKQAIERRFAPVLIQTFDRGDAIFYRVRVGRESSEERATDLGRQLRQAGFASTTFVVRLD